MPEEELVAAASELRLDDVNIARSFCKVFAARARAAEAYTARAKAFGAWRRCTERAAPAAPASEGVEGGRSSDPSSGRRRRRIISLFAAMRAARRRSYAVSPYVRAREEWGRRSARVARARVATSAGRR